MTEGHFFRYVRTKLAAQMQLRMVPEVRFIYDEAAERGEEVRLLHSPTRLVA